MINLNNIWTYESRYRHHGFQYWLQNSDSGEYWAYSDFPWFGYSRTLQKFFFLRCLPGELVPISSDLSVSNSSSRCVSKNPFSVSFACVIEIGIRYTSTQTERKWAGSPARQTGRQRNRQSVSQSAILLFTFQLASSTDLCTERPDVYKNKQSVSCFTSQMDRCR